MGEGARGELEELESSLSGDAEREREREDEEEEELAGDLSEACMAKAESSTRHSHQGRSAMADRPTFQNSQRE